MRTPVELALDERGSMLLISLVFIFVMTMLGLALFNLGAVESRLVYTSQDDARAFQIAQAGVERAFFKIRDTFNKEGQDWAEPAGTPLGSTALCSGGTHRGCSDSQFYPVASSYISTGSSNFDNGSYSIEFKQVTAQTLSVGCQNSGVVSDVDSTKKICKDLMFVRVTGTLAPSATSPDTAPGYTATRTIQLLAGAKNNPRCILCGGIAGSAATGLPINGNVRIAGKIEIAGVEGTRSLDLGGGSGQTNSYAELDGQSLARMPTPPLVCPLGTTCASTSDLVESLGAFISIAHPINIPAVRLTGTATLGQNGTQTYSADASRKGKGPLDGVFVADGCTMPCTDNFTGVTLNSNIFVDADNITKPYTGQDVPYKKLTDSWIVDDVTYDHFACVSGSSCTPPGSPTTQEYFVSRAANLMTLPSSKCIGGGQHPPPPGPPTNNPSPGCGSVWSPGFSGTSGPLTFLFGCPTGCPAWGGTVKGLGDWVAPFEVSVTFIDKSGSPVNGKICWDRANAGPIRALGVPISTPGAVDATHTPPGTLPGLTLEFGSPTCDTPTTADNPMLLYVPIMPPTSDPQQIGLAILRNGGPSNYSYRGTAIIVTNGLVTIEETLQTCQTTTSGTACFNSLGNGGPDLFTREHSLTVMTWGGAGCTGCGNMNVGKDQASIERIMGLFYAGCDPTDSACGTSKGIYTSQKQTNIVGSITAYRLCFAGGAAPCSTGGNVPSFFQVIPVHTPFVVNDFLVKAFAPYWVECKRTPGDTLPTGLCNYTP